MEKIRIAFDVDGTLRSNRGSAMVPNTDITELLRILSGFKNIECHIWSGGGRHYALRAREQLKLTEYVQESHCHSKSWDKEEQYDICIDDQHEFTLGKINLICREK